jgi:hypothetical protein
LSHCLYANIQAKKGEGNYVFYQSNLDIAAKYGYPDLFEAKKKKV